MQRVVLLLDSHSVNYVHVQETYPLFMLTGRKLEVPGELAPLSFHKLCLDMHVNKTKFKRNSSLEHYHMICIGRTKHTC